MSKPRVSLVSLMAVLLANAGLHEPGEVSDLPCFSFLVRSYPVCSIRIKIGIMIPSCVDPHFMKHDVVR